MIFYYKCSSCGQIIQRKVERAPKIWLKSYCSRTGKDVRLRLIVEK